MRRQIIPALTLLLSAFACAPALETVPEVAPPKNWDAFTVLMWQYQTDVRRDHAIYESLNLRGFHVDKRNDEAVALGKAKGWPFYLDHAADKGILHLGDNDKNPNVAAVTKKRELLVRPNSLADQANIAKMQGFLAERIAAVKGSTAIAYALDDEISLGFFASPVETDTSPPAVAFFQKQLKAQYGTIAKLNVQYGTQFADFSAVKPTGFDEARTQMTVANLAKINLSAWCDWRSAMDTHFSEVLAGLTTYANGIDNAVPTGFVGGQQPSPWGGYDWRKLCKSAQWVEAYDIGASNAIIRSFWTQKRPHMQTYFPSKNLQTDAWFLWYYLCQGNRGVIAWPEGWIVNGKPAPHIVALAPTFKEIQGPVSRAIIDAELQPEPVAIYYSHPSVQMSWALDASVHGKSWPHRLSSMDNKLSTGGHSRVGWLKSLQDVGVQPFFIHQDHLLGGELAKRGVKMLILNRALCLSDAEVAAIRAFATAGGMVVADHLCALFDEHGKVRPAGALDDLFGVKRDLAQGLFNGKDLTEVNGELGGDKVEAKNWAIGAAQSRHVAVVERGLSAVAPVTGEAAGSTTVVVRKGKAVYLNLSPIGYLQHRSDGQGQAWLDLVSGLLTEAGVAPRLTVQSGDAPAKLIETLFWKNGKRTTVCVVRNPDRAATINSMGDTKGDLGTAAIPIKLQFAAPVKDLRNERTGAVLGAGASFTDTFVPWEANVYSFAN